MRRTTRSRHATPGATLPGITILSSPPSRNSESSSLTPKRPFDDKENDGVLSAPRSKRVALSDQSNTRTSYETSTLKSGTKTSDAAVELSSLNSPEWDVRGHYSVQCKGLDTSAYTLIFYYGRTFNEELFAMFNFDNLDLKGMMNLCPSSSLRAKYPQRSITEPWTLREFKDTIRLPEKCKRPGPASSDWLMM